MAISAPTLTEILWMPPFERDDPPFVNALADGLQAAGMTPFDPPYGRQNSRSVIRR